MCQYLTVYCWRKCYVDNPANVVDMSSYRFNTTFWWYSVLRKDLNLSMEVLRHTSMYSWSGMTDTWESVG